MQVVNVLQHARAQALPLQHEGFTCRSTPVTRAQFAWVADF